MQSNTIHRSLAHLAKTAVVAAVALLLIVGSPGLAGTVWSFADDFSTTQNPSGAWRYGWLSAFGGTMGSFDGVRNDSSGVPEWWVQGDDGIVHGVAARNVAGQPVDGNYGSQYWETGMAGLHPGSGGDMGTARWTAESASLVTVSARFTAQSFTGGGTTTDVHVLKNGVSLFDGTINGFAGRGSLGYADAFGPSPVQTFGDTFAVAAGDTIDFCVGYGNGNYGYDITGLVATITARDDVALVQGKVTLGITGNPGLPGAVVRTTDETASTVTGSDGSYSLLVPVGSRTVEASYPGLKTVPVVLNVAGGAVFTRDFTLFPDYGPTYFVSPTGNDSADGQSPVTAWRTISNGDAKQLLQPGDTVLVAEGTYAQVDYWGVVLQNCSGQSGNPITYKAVGQVVIDQTNIAKPIATSFGFRVLASNVRIQGFEIIGCQWGIYFGTSTHDNSASECVIHDLIPGDPNAADWHSWCGGVFISSSSQNLVSRNLIYDAGTPGGSTAGCVMTTGVSTGNKIYNNTLANSWSGVHAWANSGVGAHDIRNNIVTGMRGHGIDNGGSTGCIGSHNLFFANLADYGSNASPGEGDLSADPKFVVGGSYHLQSTSPAIDSGESVGLPFSGLAPDRGAFEYLPENAGKIGYAKFQPDGTIVDIQDAKAVTAATLTFADRSLYIEEPDRASGIKVVPSAGLSPVSLGDRITLRGTMSTDASGERVINATAIDSQSPGTAIKPLGMSGRSMAAKIGMNPRGLLVRTSGWVTYGAADGSYVYVDDGSKCRDGSGQAGVRVALSGLVLPPAARPAKYQFVTITGLIGAFTDGSVTGPIVRLRGGDDLSVLPVMLSEMTRRENWVNDNLAEGASTRPFSFTYNGQPSSALLESWNQDYATTEIDDERTQRTITYTDPATGLEVRCVSVEYGYYPTVEWTVYLRNTGSSDTPIIENLQALDESLTLGSAVDPVLHYNIGSPASQSDYGPLDAQMSSGSVMRIGATGGRASESYLPFFNVESDGGGVIVAVGWPGQWSAEIKRDSADGVSIVAGQELTHFTLHPGEEVRTPLMVLQFWNGDQVGSQNVWRRWMLAYNVPKPGGQLPAPRYAATTFDTFGGQSTTTDEFYFMNRYLAAGVQLDVWWVDAGWYPGGGSWGNVGTWEVDTSRYPNGQREFFDYAHANGMRSQVWYEPERVTSGSWLAVNHPEWILGGSGGGLLNLGNPDALDWLVNHIDDLMTVQGVDDYRQDFNMAPLGYWRGNDAADRQGITENKHVVGYLAYWDELRRRHPDMLMDSCASGGRRNDLETLRRAVPLWRSDSALEPVGDQCRMYGISSWMPFSGDGVRTNDVYTFRSSMAPSIVDVRDVRNTSIDLTALANLVAQWRSVATNYYGDYYPLTPYSLASDVWMAWQFNRPEAGQGVVQAFRRGSGASSSITLKLYGLDPDASYTLTDLDDGTPQVRTGQYLMDTGLSVSSSAAPGAVIIRYQKH